MHGKQIVALGLIVCILCGCSASTPSDAPSFVRDAPEKKPKTEALKFPVELEYSTLIAEKVICYQGPFWEDDSGRQVEDAAALMLYNPTDRLVEFAAFAVDTDEKTLYFFVHHLLPKSRCLVLEKNAQSCDTEHITGCRELGIRWSQNNFSPEQIDYVGLGPLMTIVNRDTRTLEHVTVHYKRYVRDGDYYLGGAVFSVHLFDLQTEERRTVRPEHYMTTDAKIVGIEVRN